MRCDRNTRWLAMGAAAMLLLGLVACGSSDSGDASAFTSEKLAARNPHDPESSKIIGVQYRATSAAPFLAAQDEGIARKYGITLEPSWAESSPAALTALLGGKGQVATVSGWSVVNAVNQGLDVRIIGEAFRSVPDNQTLEVLPGSEINNIKDLVGKTVAVPALKSGHDARLIYALQQQGVDPASVKLVSVPYGDMASSLQQGTIDAATVTGVAQANVRTLDSKVVFDYTGGQYKSFPDLQWVTSGTFARSNPNAIAAFQCAVILDGEKLVDSNDDVYAKALEKHLRFTAQTMASTPKVQYPADLDVHKLQIMPDIMESIGWINEPFSMASVSIPLPKDCG